MPPINQCVQSVRVRTKFVGGGSVLPWGSFITSLKENGIQPEENLAEPDAPELLLLNPVSDQAIAELAEERLQRAGPLLAIVLRRSELSHGQVWRLMRNGADDVLILDELVRPA